MYSAHAEGVIAIRLEAGEDVHASLLSACQQHDVRQAYVVSGIGMLADPTLGYFVSKGQYEQREVPGRFELLSLSGNICLHDGKLMAHLHAMLAHEDLSVFGGHLFAAKVGLTLEALLNVIPPSIRMYRQLEDETGLAGLLVE